MAHLYIVHNREAGTKTFEGFSVFIFGAVNNHNKEQNKFGSI
jgi:hypothetical protein